MTEDYIYITINIMKIRKPAEPNEICFFMIIFGKNVIVEMLKGLLNFMFNKDLIPKIWHQTII